MGGELRCVHALDGGDAVGEIALLGGEQRVFKYVGALAEVVEEEVGGGVAGAFVVA